MAKKKSIRIYAGGVYLNEKGHEISIELFMKGDVSYTVTRGGRRKWNQCSRRDFRAMLEAGGYTYSHRPAYFR